MKKVILGIILLNFFTILQAQEPQRVPDRDSLPRGGRFFTLDDCMLYAVEHNTGVKKQEFTNDNYKQQYISAIAALVPSIGADVYATSSYGRSIDPETNTYTTTGNFRNSYSIDASVPIFAGLSNINTIRLNKAMRLMGLAQLQQAKDNVAIETMKAYFDVVYYTNSVEITREQLETSRATLAQSIKSLELGLKSAADVAQVESQVASDDLLLTQQQNNLNIALLNLKKQMNYPVADPLEIDTQMLCPAGNMNNSLEETINYALANNPRMLASDYDLRQSRFQYKAYRGRYYPSITLGGGYSTNYYKSFQKSLDPDRQTLPFWDQFKGNRGYYYQFSMSIPIFNSLSRRTTAHRYRNAMKIAEQTNLETERDLRTEITQTALEMEGYDKEYIMATKKVDAADLSYKASLHKYKLGTESPIDLQTNANLLLTAKSQQLNARLQFLIRTRLIEYFNGTPLIREDESAEDRLPPALRAER